MPASRLARLYQNHVLIADSHSSETRSGLPFQTMLRKKRYDKALEFLKSQTPSGVHLALEQIGPMASGDQLELAEGFH